MKAHRIKCWNLGSDHYLSAYGARGGAQHIPLAGEAIAQGRLIAAAPDLLREAMREVDWLRHVRPQIQAPDSVLAGFDQAIKYLSAAIAKAEGAQ